ncbi:hypothetical protein PG997_014818 [Apiospora hydei]|uniref:DUF952 domain-containing protein n=1 Tax=Apiospora hydei TaxID=1337664 RepID=A0ABR1UXF1_9PEZI
MAAAQQQPTKAFKILSAVEWQAWHESGTFRGASIDLTDGYIHLSTAAQSKETFEKYFAGQTGLVVAEVDLSPGRRPGSVGRRRAAARSSPTSTAASRGPPSPGSSRRSMGSCSTSSWQSSHNPRVVLSAVPGETEGFADWIFSWRSHSANHSGVTCSEL